MKNKIIALNVVFIIGILFILMGLYALRSNITMKRTLGEITYCQRVSNTVRNEKYWYATAKFFVDGTEYSGYINVTSHKYVGQKIEILYNPKNPNNFISQSSTYSGIIMIIFGIVFFIPKLINIKKNKMKTTNS